MLVSRKTSYIVLLLINVCLLVALSACMSTSTQGQSKNQHLASNKQAIGTATATQEAAVSGLSITKREITVQVTVIATIAATIQPTTPVQSTALSPVPTTPASNPIAPPVSSSNGVPGATAEENQLIQQLFNLINQDRASQGLPAYTADTTLNNGARLHSLNMIQCGLTHACPNEPQPCQRVINEGIQYSTCGENVGYSSPSPTSWGGLQRIEQSMLDEPPPAGHRHNLLNTGFHRIGLGVCIDSKGLVWVTEDFTN